MHYHLLVLFFLFILSHVVICKTPFVQNPPAAKFDNPNNIKDRAKTKGKPQMPISWKERNRQPFNPAWMDYCDPYHCGDYHKIACGLNRVNMKFKWFQSQCHLILNNQCAYFRGLLKYDIVDTKFCMFYVMHLRRGCPRGCGGEMAPVCALDPGYRPLLFRNSCELEMANCGSLVEKFEEVNMSVCDYHWQDPYLYDRIFSRISKSGNSTHRELEKH